MKKMKELMTELGFNPDASFEAKKAFIKHLIREAHFQDVHRTKTNQLTPVAKNDSPQLEEQLTLFPLTGTEK